MEFQKNPLPIVLVHFGRGSSMMNCTFTSFSNWIEEATQPNHLAYYPLQATLFATISYICTASFTSSPPMHGMTFILCAYTINCLIAPLFARCYNLYQEIALVPFIGQVIHITCSLMAAKTICHRFGQPLSSKEARQISILFLATLSVSRFILLQLRQ